MFWGVGWSGSDNRGFEKLSPREAYQMKKSKFLVTMLLSCILGTAAVSAHAILSFDDASRNPLTPGVLDGALDAVARMDISYGGAFAGYCTANLLSGGLYAITAAHCVGGSMDAQLRFMGGEVRGVTESFTPGGGLFSGGDIAVLRLDAPVTTIAGYEFATGSVVGETLLMAGYGRVGIGPTGWTDLNLEGRGFWGYNTVDAVITADPSGVEFPGGGQLLAMDFDDGSQNHDVSCFFYSACHLGLGRLESFVAFGDSGGAGLVWSGGQWQLAGVLSHGAFDKRQPCSFDSSQMCGDFDDTPFNSSWGERGFYSGVRPHLDWIQSIISGNPGNQVPEPSTLALLGLGFIAALRARRVPSQSSPKLV
jgi:PEP-CTERM motif